MIERTVATPREPIAVVGIGCRLPGADGPDAFWRLLVEGRDAIREIPRDRFDIDALFDERPATPGRIMTRWGGFLEGLDRFDAQFFGISPREADRLDPQQRLLLEVGWEALEDAGQSLQRLDGAHTGVFVGAWLNDYESRLFRNPRAIDFYMTTGTGRYSASGRLSYAFGFEGPSITIDCACSSSLVAVHLACRSLWSGESTLALAGGSNVILEPYIHIAYSQSRMMAPDGRCKFGDARADGYVRSEGAAIVVLKPLSRAVADRDPIYATIIGSAVNNDGRSSGFLATPGQAGQETMLRRAYADAGVPPRACQYVEAHGTGTRAGDPVEVGAIGAVLGGDRSEDAACRVGSVKTNIGHTEGAAGVSGLIKVALALKRGQIPASLHCQELNPNIPWHDLRVRVQRELEPWPEGMPAIAGVSSFGIAGTNAHVVLQRWSPASDDSGAGVETGRPRVVVLSAQSEAALKDLAGAWGRGIREAERGLTLADVAYTAAARRTHHDHRLAVVASDLPELSSKLDAYASGEADVSVATGIHQPDRPHKTVFFFPGQGSQWLGMGRRLLAEQPVCRDAAAACDAAIRRETGWSVLDELAAEPDASRLTQIDVIQPVLFSMQVALAALWRSWGVEPDAVVGHSMGEVAAAHVAGALSLDDAARVICRRSRLLKRTSGQGAMAVIGLSFDKTAEAIAGLDDKLSVAVSNSPRSTVVSGDPATLDELIAALERRDVFCRRVKVDVASHSPQMDPLRAELLEALQELQPRPGGVPICSTVLNELTDGAGYDAAYWVRNLRQPVLFSNAIQRLIASGHDTFVEVSPHPLLASSVQEVLQDAGAQGVVVGSLLRDEDDARAIGGSIASLWTAGRTIDVARLAPLGRVAPLPTYRFQRERHWLELPSSRSTSGAAVGRSLSGTRLSSPIPSFELECSVETDDWLGEVRYDGAALVSAATVTTIAAAVARERGGGGRLDGVTFAEPAILPDQDSLVLQTVVLRETPDGGSLQIHRRQATEGAPGWAICASADFSRAGSSPAAPASLAEARERCRGLQESDGFYRALAARGIDVREDARAIREVYSSAGERLARVDATGEGDRRVARLVEACLHLMATASGDAPQFIRVPERIGSVTLPSSAAGASWVLVTTNETGDAATCVWFDPDGAICAQLEDVALRRVRPSAFAGTHRARTAAWAYDLIWEPVAAEEAAAGRAGRALVVLGADTPIGEALAGAIDASGGSAVRVAAGERFTATTPGSFEIDPLNAADYARLLREAALDAAAPVGGFVHAWGVAPDPDPLTADALESRARLHGLSALVAAQALDDSADSSLRLWILTRGAQAVSDRERPQVAAAPLWGLGRVLALEAPGRFAGLIDLDPAASDRDNAAAAADFVGSRGEAQIAVRHGASFAPRLVAAGRAASSGALRIRADGAYLVTGGLGRLGLQVARWLAENGAGHVVLVGRRGLPAREEWADVPERSDAARQLRAIAALEQLGTRVTAVAVDTSDPSAMGDLFSRFGAALPPLRGIVHAAGRIDYRPIAQIGAAELEDVCRAKVKGTWLLHELTRDGRHPLDFFALFSSGASVWGSRHLAHYAAANHVLDAVAHLRRADGLPATAINWGWWEGGATTADAEALFAHSGLRAMAGDDALQAMADVLLANVPQRIVAAIDWNTFKPTYESGGSRLLARIETSAQAAPASRARGGLRREIAALEASAATARIFEHVRNEVGAVIGRDPAQLDVARGFFKLGMDSLMTVELRRRLEAALDAALPATVAFEYPTITALSGFIAAQVVPRAPLPAVAAAALETAGAGATAPTSMLDGHSDDELASMLDDEIARLLGEPEEAK